MSSSSTLPGPCVSACGCLSPPSWQSLTARRLRGRPSLSVVALCPTRAWWFLASIRFVACCLLGSAIVQFAAVRLASVALKTNIPSRAQSSAPGLWVLRANNQTFLLPSSPLRPIPGTTKFKEMMLGRCCDGNCLHALELWYVQAWSKGNPTFNLVRTRLHVHVN